MKKKTTKRLIHVFGAAGLRDQAKRPLMGRASGEFADIIILTEEDYRTEDVNTIVSEIASGIAPSKEVYREYDRAQAIDRALSMAEPNDTVIVTGKGHEKSLCRGTIEYPWSDQEEVRKVLKRLGRKSSS
jgi:UDP-N-acetylmuramoyl-L-alanyl-D-glutamate--2,6-diaminopimelate ligase